MRTRAGAILEALLERISEELTEPEQSVSRLETEDQELADRMLREREAAAGALAFAERGVIEQVMRVEAYLSRELHRMLAMLAWLARRTSWHGMGRRCIGWSTEWGCGRWQKSEWVCFAKAPPCVGS
jgi:hypothetical protein